MDGWRYNNAEAKCLFSKKELVDSNGNEDKNTNTNTNLKKKHKHKYKYKYKIQTCSISQRGLFQIGS